MHRLLDHAHVPANAARQPIAAAQLVQHRSANALCGVSLELRALCFLIAPHRVHQADHARLDKVVDFDACRQLRHDVMGNALYQRSVLFHPLLPVLCACCCIHCSNPPACLSPRNSRIIALSCRRESWCASHRNCGNSRRPHWTPTAAQTESAATPRSCTLGAAIGVRVSLRVFRARLERALNRETSWITVCSQTAISACQG